MRSNLSLTMVVATIFALFHILVVAIPVLSSGGSGETQAFAAAIFDLPLFWLLGLFPAGRAVLYGSSPSVYVLVFSVGGHTHVRSPWCIGWSRDAQRDTSLPCRLTPAGSVG